MKHTVQVRADDIKKYLDESSYSDPVQAALERQGFGICVVTSTSFITFAAFSLGNPVRTVPLPMHVGDRLKALQLGQRMEPFEFDIEL
jgi:hypothetical protein